MRIFFLNTNPTHKFTSCNDACNNHYNYRSCVCTYVCVYIST